MPPANARPFPAQASEFEDGFGRRHLTGGATDADEREALYLREELTNIPSFEFALRERVNRLASFHHSAYGPVHNVERFKQAGSTLAIMSEHVPGVRLATILADTAQRKIVLDINAAVALIRQLVSALAVLHEEAPDVIHGALAPERIVITPSARLVIVEYVLGGAVEQLQYAQTQYWEELSVGLPQLGASLCFDRRADVTQVGLVALALILGRPLAKEEYPTQIGKLVGSAWATSVEGGRSPLPPGIRRWLSRALQLDPRSSFTSCVDANAQLDGIPDETSAALEAFLTRYYSGFRSETSAELAAPSPVAHPAPVAAAAPLEAAQPAPASPGPSDTLRSTPPTPPTEKARATGSVPPVAPSAAPVKPAPSAPVAPPPTISVLPMAASVSVPLSQTPKAAPKTVTGSNAAAAMKPESKTPAVETKIVPLPSPIEPSPLDQFKAASPAPTVEPKDVTLETWGEEEEEDEPRTPKRRQWPLAVAAIVAGLAVSGALAFGARRYLMSGADAPRTGTVVVDTNPSRVPILIDGQSKGSTPVTLTLSAGNHVLQLLGPDDPRTIPLNVTAGNRIAQYVELRRTQAAETGQLQVRTDPPGAKVSVDGKLRGSSPLTIDDLTPGTHKVDLENDSRSVSEDVTVEAGAAGSLVVPLGAPASSGWVSLSTPVDTQLYENGRLIGNSSIERIMLPAGRHDLDIVNEALQYRVTRTVQVAPGKVSVIKLDWPKGTVSLNASPWAEVWVDGEKVGETPIGNLALPIGPHEIIFRHPELGDRTYAITATANSPTRLSVDLTKK